LRLQVSQSRDRFDANISSDELGRGRDRRDLPAANRPCKLFCWSGAIELTVPPRRTLSRKQPRKGRTKARAGTRRAKKSAGAWFEKLVELQARLRAPGGCPWDREQTHESLRKFLIEETYEVLAAMESGDASKFSSELGDLLLQIVFHSNLAEESGRFNISDVIESIHTKMVRRHPHVFGKVKAKTSPEVLKNWEQIKAEERREERGADKPTDKLSDGEHESVLAGVPRSLPAVLEAYQLTRRASHIGFDWDNLSGILDKLDEEKRELQAISANALSKSGSDAPHIEDEVGDLLFVAVNIARFVGVDPEIALKKANRKFTRRFHWMESAATREGHRFADLPRARMEELWNESKIAEESAGLAAERRRS
jgi:tetrapyrrole methylase family protein / MazG family protein